MSLIVFCNVGTRDVTLGQPEKLSPRSLGERYLADLDKLRDQLQFPIIQNVLQEVLDSLGGVIDHLIFIGTDQQSEKFSPRDTCFFAQIMAQVIPDRFPGRLRQVKVATVGANLDPSLYDEALDAIAPILLPYAADEEATCIVLPTGGIPACNTALILQGVRLFGRRCHIFYQSESGAAIPLEVGAKVLGVLHENAILEALNRFEFATARTLWAQSGRQNKMVESLLRYGSARLRFDFDAAYAHLNSALAAARGQERDRLQIMRQEFKQLLDKDDLARIGELYHNARIYWENGRCVDFLGRLVRFFTAVLYRQIQATYGDVTGREWEWQTFRTLAVTPDMRQLLLQSLALQAGQAPAESAVDKALLTSFTRFLEDAYNLEDLRALCFDLSIDDENIAGQTKSARILALIEYMRRRGQFNQLVSAATGRRPHNPWTPPAPLPVNNQVVIVAALQRLERLVDLRNESIIGHGYRGVSVEIIRQVYPQPDGAPAAGAPAAGDQEYTPLGDMAAICTALGIDIANPFREIGGMIRKALL